MGSLMGYMLRQERLSIIRPKISGSRAIPSTAGIPDDAA